MTYTRSMRASVLTGISAKWRGKTPTPDECEKLFLKITAGLDPRARTNLTPGKLRILITIRMDGASFSDCARAANLCQPTARRWLRSVGL